MKNIFQIIFFACLTFGTVNAQNKSFEGTIHYKHLVIMKDSTQSNLKLVKFYGTHSELSIKDGNYSWTYSNSPLVRELFLQKENKLISEYKDKKAYYYQNTTIPEEKILKIYPIKPSKKGEILGKKCDILMIKSQFLGEKAEVRGRVFFFSKDYPLDPKMFANLKTNNQDIIYEKIKAVPLRIIIIHKDYKVIFFARHISDKARDIDFYYDKAFKMIKL